jgi:hypothetical protein
MDMINLTDTLPLAAVSFIEYSALMERTLLYVVSSIIKGMDPNKVKETLRKYPWNILSNMKVPDLEKIRLSFYKVV